MLFGDVMAIALSIIGFLLSLQGMWLICRALWPGRVEAATVRCRDQALACFLTGIPVMGLTLLFAVVIGKRLGTFGIIAGSMIGLLLLFYACIGVAGLTTHLGQRLASPADAQRPWRATVRGGVVLELAYLIPILGWFGLLPISLILGAGATTLSFFGSKGAVGPVAGVLVPGAALGSAVTAMRPPAMPVHPPRMPPSGGAAERPELQETSR